MNQFYEEKLQIIQIPILMRLLTLYNKKGKRKTEDDEEENKQEAFNWDKAKSPQNIYW